jgi:hypothetical protein
VVSAAIAPEISTDRPSGRYSPSRRLTRLTAGPIAVKSSRSAAPIYSDELQRLISGDHEARSLRR